MSELKNVDISWPGIDHCLRLMNKRMDSGLLCQKSLELIKECLEMTKAKVDILLSKIDKVETIDDIKTVDFKEWRKTMFLRTSISDLELSVRAYNALKTARIDTIGQLVKLSESDLLRLPNLGKRSLADIKLSLSNRDFMLGMDDE